MVRPGKNELPNKFLETIYLFRVCFSEKIEGYEILRRSNGLQQMAHWKERSEIEKSRMTPGFLAARHGSAGDIHKGSGYRNSSRLPPSH